MTALDGLGGNEVTELTDEAVKALLNLLRSETEAASRTDAADMLEALHAELAQASADAKAAVAVVVEKAAGAFPDGRWTWPAYAIRSTIRALAPEDAIAEVAKLRAERDEWKRLAIAGELTARHLTIVQTELAAAIAREAGLRAALNMAKKHMIVNDLSLPNVFAVIDAALTQPSTEGGK